MTGELTAIFLSAMLVINFALFHSWGLCPFMGVSGRVETALRIGAADIFVLLITSVTVWLLNTFVLSYVPYLRLTSFVVVIDRPVEHSRSGQGLRSGVHDRGIPFLDLHGLCGSPERDMSLAIAVLLLSALFLAFPLLSPLDRRAGGCG